MVLYTWMYEGKGGVRQWHLADRQLTAAEVCETFHLKPEFARSVHYLPLSADQWQMKELRTLFDQCQLVENGYWNGAIMCLLTTMGARNWNTVS